MIVDLRPPNLRKIEIGTEVISLKGHHFKLLNRTSEGETWLDVSSGLTWLPISASKINHYEAEKHQTDSQRLPTKEEFEVAERHGFRDVLDNMNGRWFWSSSVHPDYSLYAYHFHGRIGYIYVDYRDLDDDFAVRCVSRR